MRVADESTGVSLDDEFDTSSAGKTRCTGAGEFVIGPKPESIPTWFQTILDEYFDGRGVPKEYLFHVRVTAGKSRKSRLKLRFEMSDHGKNYLYPPWWIRPAHGDWRRLPAESVVYRADEVTVDVELEVKAGLELYIASAPVEHPTHLESLAREFVDHQAGGSTNLAAGWKVREIGRSANDRSIFALESDERSRKICIAASMQSAEPVGRAILGLPHWLNTPVEAVEKVESAHNISRYAKLRISILCSSILCSFDPGIQGFFVSLSDRYPSCPYRASFPMLCTVQ